MIYDAFVSYSHKGDVNIAQILRRALSKIAKPWYRLRSFNVFMDETNLSASSDLTESIHKALSNSRYFIYMASPESASSKWVGKEIDAWKKTGSPENLLIAVTSGEIEWDLGCNCFNWDKSNSLHPKLKGIFSSEPLWVDLRWARNDENLSVRDPRFQHAVAMLGSSIIGKTLDELVGEDIKQHRRTKRMIFSVTSILILLLVFSFLTAVIASKLNQSLFNKIVMIERIFPFFSFNDVEKRKYVRKIYMDEDDKSILSSLMFSINANMSLSIDKEIWVKWGPRMLVVEEDCQDYYKFVKELKFEEKSWTTDCPKMKNDFDQDGLRRDIPGINAIANCIVRSLNNSRLKTILTSGGNIRYEAFSLSENYWETNLKTGLYFLSMLLPDHLWNSVHEYIKINSRYHFFKRDKVNEIAPNHRYINIWRHPLQSVAVDAELVFILLNDHGFCGSMGCQRMILGFLKVNEQYELVLAEISYLSEVIIYDNGYDKMPQIFIIGGYQSGHMNQYSRVTRYYFENDIDKLYYIPHIAGVIYATNPDSSSQVPKDLKSVLDKDYFCP